MGSNVVVIFDVEFEIETDVDVDEKVEDAVKLRFLVESEFRVE